MKNQRNSIMDLYKEDILRDLAQLISIKSVTSDREECKRAMEFVVARAKEMGLEAQMPDELYCYAELGEGEDYDAILTHLDVVPVGDGWNTDPFCLTEQDGFLFGRGVADDKGSAIASLYCLKALKDNGITPKRRIRCIFGSAEETGMSDMTAYFANNPLPHAAFTPDAEFPVCSCEKGILQLEISLDDANSSIIKLECGSAVNCVADRAFMEFNCDEDTKKEFIKYLNDNNVKNKLTLSHDGLLVTFSGKSAHAMEPQNGESAIFALLDALKAVGYNSPLVPLIFSLKDKEGFNFSDERSGELTSCVGLLNKKDEKLVFTLDIRYPVCTNNETLTEIVKSIAERYGATVRVRGHQEPINFSDDAPLICMLKEAYEEVTGKPASCYSTGGGTYARALGGRGVAFGPVFPDAPDARLHMSDENLRKDDYFAFIEICYAAMKKMAEN